MSKAGRENIAGKLAQIIEHVLGDGSADKFSVADLCDCSPRTALRYLHCLEASRLIERVEGTGAGTMQAELYKAGEVLDRHRSRR